MKNIICLAMYSEIDNIFHSTIFFLVEVFVTHVYY